MLQILQLIVYIILSVLQIILVPHILGITLHTVDIHILVHGTNIMIQGKKVFKHILFAGRCHLTTGLLNKDSELRRHVKNYQKYACI